MFLDGIIRRRLLSSLSPWLRERPELEVELGVIRSHAIAKNLKFDALVLNELVGESSNFIFEELNIGEFIFHFSNWSVHSFTVEVRDVNILLSVRELDRGGTRNVQKSNGMGLSGLDKKLSEMDPEGAALHATLRKLSTATPSNNGFKSSLLNLIYRHCLLEIHGIKLQLQFPMFNDGMTLVSEAKELSVFSQPLEQGSLFRDVIRIAIGPLRESSLVMSLNHFRIGFKRNDHITNACHCKNLLSYAMLRNRQFVALNLHVPEVKFSSSPLDLAFFVICGEVLARKVKHHRKGRHLWRVAARRISSVTSAPRFTLYKSINDVVRWLRYLQSYEELLSLVGYPSIHELKRSALRLYEDETFLGTIRHRMKFISDMENDLQPDAIVRARRIGRYRISRTNSVQVVIQPGFTHWLKLLYSILALLTCFVREIYKVLKYVLFLDFLWTLLLQEEEVDGSLEGSSGESLIKSNFSLNIGLVQVTVPLNKERNPTFTGHMESHILFSMIMGAISVKYSDNTFEQSFLLSCGNLRVSSTVTGGVSASGSRSASEGAKGHQDGNFTSSKTIIWGEPLANHFSSITSENENVDPAVAGGASYLQKFLGEMWTKWQISCGTSEDMDAALTDNPFILFELKSCLVYTAPCILASNHLKCNLAVGKLNVALGCTSTASIALLFRQMNHAVFWREDITDEHHPAHLRACEDQSDASWNSNYNNYFYDVKLTLLDILPQRNIELGAFIAGPQIRIPFQKDGFTVGKSNMNYHGSYDFQLAVDFHDIGIALWPTSENDFSTLLTCNKYGDLQPNDVMLDDTFKLAIATANGEKYMSQVLMLLGLYLRFSGVTAYLENLRSKKKMQFFALNPVTFQLASLRKYVDSFSRRSIALSAVFHGISSGFMAQLFTDEIRILFQAVLDLLSETILPLETVPNDLLSLQEYVLKDLAHAEPKNQDNGEKGSPFADKDTSILIKGSVKLDQLDLILQKSRSNKDLGGLIRSFDAGTVDGYSMLDSGSGITLKQASIHMLCQDRKMEILIDISKIQSTVFTYESNTRAANYSPSETLALCSAHSLHEMSFSSLTITLCCCSPQQGAVSIFPTADTEISSQQSSEIENSPDIVTSSLRCWLLVNISIGETLVTKNSVKDILLRAHEMHKLMLSISVGGDFQAISLKLQGGLLLIEIRALAAFLGLYASYIQCFQDLLHSIKPSDRHSSTPERASTSTLNDNPTEDNVNVPEGFHSLDQNGSEKIKAYTLEISGFSLVFASQGESGVVREIMQEVDMNLKFEMVNERTKFLVDLLRLSVTSHVLRSNINDEFHVPRFSSTASRRSSSSNSSGNPTIALGQLEGTNASSSTDTSQDNSTVLVVHLGQKKFLLKHCRAFLHVGTIHNGPSTLNGALVGGGSISGVDITISLSEIEMVLSAVGSLSGFSRYGGSKESKPRWWSNNQEIANTFEEKVPNGAIIAIQDISQHMYFAVDGGRDKYSLVGVSHYSLVEERALFRVNYQNEGRWRSVNQWFSLVSLHAKDESDQPLRLAYRRGSGFVEVSSTCDIKSSLFRAVPCKPESFEGDNVGWEPYNQLVKGAFYLLNKKNDCAIAFFNGVPEFVQKPGNPFKMKVFQDTDLCWNAIIPISCSIETSPKTDLQHEEHIAENMSRPGSCFPLIDLKVEKVSLTIVHELSDEEETFPLMQSSIDNTELFVQVLPAKVRIICTMTTWLDYFDSQVTAWRHLVNPVNICSFYRSRFSVDNRNTVKQGPPLYFHCRTNELNISLNEVSLDVLLFVIGKLDIAGPFSVRSAMIIPNRCKVENQSGANLLCQFYGKQSIKIARRQSAITQLKHSILANQVQDTPPDVSIQLSVPGSAITSPIHLLLSETQAVAWKTRIMSLDGSRSYPGPLLVVDILRKAEDGLSIVVAPLIRIHNETVFSLELRFRRPQQEKDEFALALLKKGETLDDSIAMFDATNLSGGLKKAITSLTLGNFLFSFRPEIPESLLNNGSSLSVEWSDDIKGGKAVRLSGAFDRLSYKVRRALSNETTKISFTTACCTVNSGCSHVAKMHFLIQSCTRDVPIKKPDKGNEHLPVALQEQKEIYLLPTLRVSNFLHTEIDVTLTDSDQVTTDGCDAIGNKATISCGSTADFYADPSLIYFNVVLTAFNSSCKLNSSDWVKKLRKNGKDVRFLDMNLDFGGGKYFASIRLLRGNNGILEAFIFSPYALKNKSGFPLYICTSNHKPPSRDEMGEHLIGTSPDMGFYLPPDRSSSWFMKSTKLLVQLLEENNICEAVLDLNLLSGLSEVKLEMDKQIKNRYFTKFGIVVEPQNYEVPAQLVTLVPRYVVINNSDQDIVVRQCYLEDDMSGMITVKSGQRVMLMLRDTINRSEFSLFENMIRKHRNSNDDSVIFVQFQLCGPDFGWSGPVCVASLGRFFLKFRRQLPNQEEGLNKDAIEFANVCIVEEGSSLIMHFNKPPNMELPYRIENRLVDAIITYYQKDSSEPEVLQPDSCIDYVWDDLTLPHKLVIRISDIHELREINLDKVREWKPLFKVRRYGGLSSDILPNKRLRNDKSKIGGSKEITKVGYEVYADGLTRVLSISEASDDQKIDKTYLSLGKIRLRIPHLAIHMFELKVDGSEPSVDTQILIPRLGYINMDALFSDRQKYSQISVKSLDVLTRWEGAPFAAMLRRHQLDDDYLNECILKIVIILKTTNSNVRQVQYSSIILQPVDLNLDEETLMKLVPFWRSSLSDSNRPSQQYYFDHFEIHPIKVFANFLSGNSYSNYSSAQETLRSFIHSVIKIPPMRNAVVELNGVLVTHALVTLRELSIRCAQHYTWYAMRAIYIAKGSPLLPPGFASIFDDLASSSLDVFFDPSHGLMKLPGFTLGTFKLLSKSIGGKGFYGTKRYFGDLGKTLRSAGSNVLFAAVTEVSDSVLRGAETSGFDGMVRGFHQGILKLAMEPSFLGSALLEGGPDRVIKLDGNPGVDELYIEGYLQAMLDSIYKQEYLRVRVTDNQVILKNLPPNSSLIEEIMDRVKEFLVSKALLKGDPSTSSRPLRHLRGRSEWRIGPTVMTLCEHLFVSFAIRTLRNEAIKVSARIKWKREAKEETEPKDEAGPSSEEYPKTRFIYKWGIGQFVMSGALAYVDGRLCRCIPNPIVRRIVSGFLLSFLDNKNDK